MSIEAPEEMKPLYPGGVMRARHHFSVSAYWFATNLLWGALLMILIPKQIRQIAPQSAAQAQGLLLGLGAIPAFVLPLVIGPLSDRCMSRWGRRRPYMATGVAINLVGLMTIWTAGERLSLWLYFVGYLVVQVGNNIASAAYNGVIPDVVPEKQRGEASGWMGAMTQAGTIVGVLGAGMLYSRGLVGISYLMIAVSLVLFLAFTAFGIRERPLVENPEPLDLVKFVKRLWIDPRKYPDFAWVWLTRALVVMGIWIVQPYLMYYLVDVVGVPDSDAAMATAKMMVVSLLCATVTGMLGGKISDRIGRKRVVYVANAVIAAACVAFLFSHSFAYTTIVAAVFGLGFGAYYSVDWALGCDVLPHKEEAAKDMAVWHIAFVLPQSIAQPLSGVILGAFMKGVQTTAEGKVPHYAHAGYAVIFSLAAFFLLLGAVLLRNVRGVK